MEKSVYIFTKDKYRMFMAALKRKTTQMPTSRRMDK